MTNIDTIKTIKPGTYRLTTDYGNPDADRRYKNDWRMQPIWEAGTIFVVDEHDTLHPVGDNKFVYSFKLGAEFFTRLEEIPETMEAMFDRLNLRREYFAQWMVRSGYLSREDFEKLHAVYMSEDLDEDETKAA